MLDAYPTMTYSRRMATPPIPYLTCSDASAALDFYTAAFNAVEQMRVVGDDGRIGHAQLDVAGGRIYLSDEYPEMDVRSPETLGGSSVAIVLDVDDTDAWFTRSINAAATALSEPADQEHATRQATILDPIGYRWMLSQQLEDFDVDTYAERMEGSGFAVHASSQRGAIWSALNLTDARAGIRLLVDVFGFEETLVVPGDTPDEIVHSQLTWPEGGVLQAASANRDGNIFSQQPTGALPTSTSSRPIPPQFTPGVSMLASRSSRRLSLPTTILRVPCSLSATLRETSSHSERTTARVSQPPFGNESADPTTVDGCASVTG